MGYPQENLIWTDKPDQIYDQQWQPDQNYHHTLGDGFAILDGDFITDSANIKLTKPLYL